jgi:hypothetical protein
MRKKLTYQIVSLMGKRTHALKPAHTEVGPPLIPRRDDLRVVRIESRSKTLHIGYFSFFQTPNSLACYLNSFF